MKPEPTPDRRANVILAGENLLGYVLLLISTWLFVQGGVTPLALILAAGASLCVPIGRAVRAYTANQAAEAQYRATNDSRHAQHADELTKEMWGWGGFGLVILINAVLLALGGYIMAGIGHPLAPLALFALYLIAGGTLAWAMWRVFSEVNWGSRR